MSFDNIFLFFMYIMMIVTPIYAIYNLIQVLIEEKDNLTRKRNNDE